MVERRLPKPKVAGSRPVVRLADRLGVRGFRVPRWAAGGAGQPLGATFYRPRIHTFGGEHEPGDWNRVFVLLLESGNYAVAFMQGLLR